MPDRAADNSWHLDKKVPLALIFAIVLQTGFAVAWVTDISRDVRESQRRMEKLEKSDEAQTEVLRIIREQYARIDERLSILVRQSTNQSHP